MTRTTLLAITLLLWPFAASAQTLSHQDAVSTAVDSNLSLLIDSMGKEVQELRATEARRPYVPIVYLRPEYVASQTAVRTTSDEVPEVLRQSRFDAAGGLRWDNRWGTSLGLGASTTPWYSNFAPTPLTSIEATLSQNLLRGAFRSGTLLDVTDLEVELQRQVFVARLNDLLVRVDAAYWELAYAQADVEIRETSRERAKSQYDDTKENISRGLLAAGDIFVVEENLVIFEEQLLRSRESLQLARLRLARLLQLEGEVGELTAADSIDAPQAGLPSVADAVGVALRENPRVTSQRIAVRQAKATAAFDANQSRPVLDFSAALGLNGLSEDFGESWGEALSGENPSLRMGLYFEVPLVGGPYRARIKRSKVQQRQEEVELVRLESEVGFDVRELLAQLESRAEALEFAKRRIQLAENKLATEQSKYERGLSTLTDLVRFQRDVDSAVSAERRARVEVLLLHTRLAGAQGVLFADVGVNVE